MDYLLGRITGGQSVRDQAIICAVPIQRATLLLGDCLGLYLPTLIQWESCDACEGKRVYGDYRVGYAHAQDNGLVAQIVGLYAFGRGLRFKSLVNVSLRRTGRQEAQPDLAYYLGEGVTLPVRSNSPMDLDRYAPPDLTIEIAATSLEDDLTVKRELYADLGAREYWVVDTDTVQVWMFAGDVDKGLLEPVDASRVLPGLSSTILAEALRLGQSEGDAAAMRYVLGLKG
ncbi:MAG: Uma2 family endonuclease [Gemmatimonadaceae bacterium]|nr:Uma2 family endonuclease [Gloeobacterales cyanobacterium ES-bin-141]